MVFMWGGDGQQEGITLTQRKAELRDLLESLLSKQLPTPEKDPVPNPRAALV